MKLLDRLLLTCFAVLILAALGAAIYGHVFEFKGQIAVAAGGKEDIVVTPTDEASRHLAPGVVAGIPGVGLPFTDQKTGRATFDLHANYNVARLPFLVSCSQIEVVNDSEPLNTLNISGPEGKQALPLNTGKNVDICGSSYQVQAVDKWSGLVRSPNGIPMAAVTIRNASQAAILLPAGEWRTCCGGVATYFAWHTDEQEARDAAAKGLDGIVSARWGVVDRGAVNWFESLTPGAGATLSNGDSITLLRFEPEHAGASGPTPAIEVEIERNAAKSTAWIEAYEENPDVPVRFEDPQGLRHVFVMHAWQENRALVSFFEKREMVGQKEVEPNGVVTFEDGTQLRLDQVLDKALPLSEAESTIYAATLTAPDGSIVGVRQGEAVRVGDCLVELARDEAPPVVRAHILLKDKDLTLDTDESVRAGDWTFRLLPNPKTPSKVILLEAQLTPFKGVTRILFALALAIGIWFSVTAGPLFPASHLV